MSQLAIARRSLIAALVLAASALSACADATAPDTETAPAFNRCETQGSGTRAAC